MTANALSKSQGARVAEYLQKLNERTKPLAALDKAKAVLALSAEALDAETRARWCTLGVFEGGFVAGAAADVWAVEDACLILDELEQRSLVSFDAHRYWLHDLLRAVALEELAQDSGRHREAQRRHAEHFFGLLQVANKLYLAGHDNIARGLALLDVGLADIRVAQRWAADTLAEDVRAAELAQEFSSAFCLTFRLSPDELLAWLKTSLAAAERRADREGQARVSGNLGLVYQARGELKRAEAMHKMSLAIDTELGRKQGMAASYGNLGLVYAAEGELQRAEKFAEKSLAMNHEIGSKEEMARGYGLLGMICSRKGELDNTEEMYERSLALNEEQGRKDGIALQYYNLGLLYSQRGNRNQAVAYWRKALALFREIGAEPNVENVSRRLRAAGVDPARDEAAE